MKENRRVTILRRLKKEQIAKMIIEEIDICKQLVRDNVISQQAYVNKLMELSLNFYMGQDKIKYLKGKTKEKLLVTELLIHIFLNNNR